MASGPIDLGTFNPTLLNCDIVSTKPSKPGDKARTVVKLSYGPSRRAIAFVTPPCVVDWPKLHGDGNFGTQFGPTEVDKAQYTMGVTDKLLPTGEHEMAPYFDALRAIDDALVACVHANQKELLSSRGLSKEEVRGKLQATVKPKYEDDALAYNRQNMSTRKFTWSGDERTLRITDVRKQPLAEPVAHQDVCVVATQVDCVYTGLMGSMFGIKWSIAEVMLLKRAEHKPQPGSDAFVDYAVPSWANAP
jgi:hypothetical protein